MKKKFIDILCKKSVECSLRDVRYPLLLCGIIYLACVHPFVPRVTSMLRRDAGDWKIHRKSWVWKFVPCLGWFVPYMAPILCAKANPRALAPGLTRPKAWRIKNSKWFFLVKVQPLMKWALCWILKCFCRVCWENFVVPSICTERIQWQTHHNNSSFLFG